MKLFRREDPVKKLSPADRKRYDTLTDEIESMEQKCKSAAIAIRVLRAERSALHLNRKRLEQFLTSGEIR